MTPDLIAAAERLAEQLARSERAGFWAPLGGVLLILGSFYLLAIMGVTA